MVLKRRADDRFPDFQRCLKFRLSVTKKPQPPKSGVTCRAQSQGNEPLNCVRPPNDAKIRQGNTFNADDEYNAPRRSSGESALLLVRFWRQ
jgi:hypothetical protein